MIWAVRLIKRRTGLQTWLVEQFFAAIYLAATGILTARLAGFRWQELVGVFAVWFLFNHQQISVRISETGAQPAEQSEAVWRVWNNTEVRRAHYGYWERRYFRLMVAVGFVYFAVLFAWSALAGVVLIGGYRWWRAHWRRFA